MKIPTAHDLQPWPSLEGYRVLVTPEMAEAWLQSNNSNRHMRHRVVERYARQMREGRWRFTHQGIAFSAKRLIDGQHRLAAIVASGSPQWLSVFVGQDDNVFGVLDHGTNRTLRDELQRDPRILEPCSFFCSIAARETRGHTAFQVQAVVDVMGAALQRLIDVSGSTPRGRVSAGIRAAVALRWSTAPAPLQAAIEEQWLAWSTLDINAMNDSIKSLLKRLDGVSSHGGSVASFQRASATWIAFNPTAPNLQKIIIRDTASTIGEMRSALQALTNSTLDIAPPALSKDAA